MIKPGLASVTFRKLSIQKIANLTARAELCGIEWGGDVHVPHSDVKAARLAAKVTKDNGLSVAGYGSYYRAGEREMTENPDFTEVLKCAVSLGAPVIRIWAGVRPSAELDESHLKILIKDSRRVADMAASEGIKIAFEYHRHTLTDTTASAQMLLRKANHPNLYSYWQPPRNLDKKGRSEGLAKIMPWLANIHVFSGINKNERLALEENAQEWESYFCSVPKDSDVKYALLEFVKDDSEEQFEKDAKSLKNFLFEGIK